MAYRSCSGRRLRILPKARIPRHVPDTNSLPSRLKITTTRQKSVDYQKEVYIINASKRWIELKYFFLITDLLLYRQNFQDIENFINAISMFGKFDPNKAIELAKKILLSDTFRPNREEFITLAILQQAPKDWIRYKAKCGRRLYDKYRKQLRKEMPAYYTHLNDEERNLIQEVYQAFNNLKKVGAQDGNRNNVGNVQSLRSRWACDESLRLS